MLPHILEDVPEFLTQRGTVAYCGLLHVKETKSSLLLSRNLKFYEFQKKELVHHIDLRNTSLQQLATQLQSYSGPTSSFLIRDDVADVSGDSTSYSMLQAAEELPLSIGKYIWLRDHIYILLKCWQTLLVLQRPSEYGANFKLIAEHDNVEEYKMVKGPIQYHAYVELHFNNGKKLLTNFQTDASEETTPDEATTSAKGFERLMQRVHSARAELQTQRAMTQQDFMRARELNTFGVAGQRSALLEEKQLLRRCGDVWTRICGNHLILGTLISNSATSNRPTMLHELRPLLYLPNGSGLSFQHCLYELPLQPDGQPPEDYDELAQFWACQEQQQSTNLSWRLVQNEAQLPPERSAVLLLCLQLVDLLELEQIHLLAIYEVHGASRRQLQLQLATINVASLLEQPELHAPTFAPQTLHQDFLAVIMTQKSHCPLRLQFQSVDEQQQFEQLLESKLGLKCTTVQQQQESPQDVQMLDEDFSFDSKCNDSKKNCVSTVQRIFYNPQTHLMLLHNDPEQHWHIYAQNETELSLLLRRLQRDLLQLHCNVSKLEVNKDVISVPQNAALLFESALRDELQAKMELLNVRPLKDQCSAKAMERVHELEYATDLLYSVIKQNQPETL